MPLINAFRMDGLGNRFIIIDRREKSINIPKEKIIHFGNLKSFHRNIEFDQIIFIEKEINNTFPHALTSPPSELKMVIGKVLLISFSINII